MRKMQLSIKWRLRWRVRGLIIHYPVVTEDVNAFVLSNHLLVSSNGEALQRRRFSLAHGTRGLGGNYIYAIECHRNLSLGWFSSLLELRMETMDWSADWDRRSCKTRQPPSNVSYHLICGNRSRDERSIYWVVVHQIYSWYAMPCHVMSETFDIVMWHSCKTSSLIQNSHWVHTPLVNALIYIAPKGVVVALACIFADVFQIIVVKSVGLIILDGCVALL